MPPNKISDGVLYVCLLYMFRNDSVRHQYHLADKKFFHTGTTIAGAVFKVLSSCCRAQQCVNKNRGEKVTPYITFASCCSNSISQSIDKTCIAPPTQCGRQR